VNRFGLQPVIFLYDRTLQLCTPVNQLPSRLKQDATQIAVEVAVPQTADQQLLTERDAQKDQVSKDKLANLAKLELARHKARERLQLRLRAPVLELSELSLCLDTGSFFKAGGLHNSFAENRLKIRDELSAFGELFRL